MKWRDLLNLLMISLTRSHHTIPVPYQVLISPRMTNIHVSDISTEHIFKSRNPEPSPGPCLIANKPQNAFPSLNLIQALSPYTFKGCIVYRASLKLSRYKDQGTTRMRTELVFHFITYPQDRITLLPIYSDRNFVLSHFTPLPFCKKALSNFPPAFIPRPSASLLSLPLARPRYLGYYSLICVVL